MVAERTSTHPVHGGLNLAELRSLGIDPVNILDFSASINPLGAPPVVREVLGELNLATYPDTDCLELREALADFLNTSPENILAGNGSTELIHLVARAYLKPGDSATIFGPTFGEYDAACRVQNVEPVYLTANDSNGFEWDIGEAIRNIEQHRPKLVFLCNPNNPTGVYSSRELVQSLARSMQDYGVLVLDEAYIWFTDNSWDSGPLLELGNVILLRSMTKDYALTGLRLGYMLARPDTIDRVRSYQPSWSVNAAAQVAGIASLADAEHLEKGRETVRTSKSYLTDALSDMALEVQPSSANFLLVEVGDATAVRLSLLRRGVCVRDCTSFGLPRYIRIGIRKLQDCETLVDAMRQVLADG